MRAVSQKQAAIDNNPAGIRWINSDLMRVQEKVMMLLFM